MLKYFCTLGLVVLSFFSVTDVYGQIQPLVHIPNTATVNTDVVFAVEVVTASTEPMWYVWDCGDGAQLIGATVTHQYDTPGQYEVTVAVATRFDTQLIAATIDVVADTAWLEHQNEQVVISELYSNPTTTADDEWIELYNPSEQPVVLSGWSVADQRHAFVFDDSWDAAPLLPQGYITLPKAVTKIALNNTAETVTLRDASGLVRDRVSYVTAPKGQSFARFAVGQWDWTDRPTYNAANQLSSAVDSVRELEQVFVLRRYLAEQATTTMPMLDQQLISSTTVARIARALPNPSGSETAEWIELVVEAGSAVDIIGWEITDASERGYTITADVVAQATTTIVLPRSRTGIALNNSGEEILILRDRDGAIIDRVAYQGPITDDQIVVFDATGVTDTIMPLLPVTTKPASDDMSEQTNRDYTGLLFDSLLPNPNKTKNEQEYIAIRNTTSSTQSLTGLSVADTVRSYQLPQVQLAPGDVYKIFSTQSKIALNNTGDTVVLSVVASEQRLDAVTYEAASLGAILVRDFSNQEWRWLRDEFDVFDQPSVSPTSVGDQVVDTYTARQQPVDATVVVQGVVIAEPGIFSQQYLYISDGVGGIQIYSHSKQWPVVHRGDVIRVQGVRSQAYGEARIKIQEIQDITTVATNTALLPQAWPSISEGGVGQVSGVVLQKTGQVLELLPHGGLEPIQIQLPAGAFLSQINSGDILTVVGIVRTKSDVLKLYVRDQHDIVVQQSTTTSQLVQPLITTTTNVNSHRGWGIAYAIVLTVSGYFIFGLIRIKYYNR